MVPRILILGSKHGREVTSYAWDDLPSNLNVADFDVVILNLVTLRDDATALALGTKKCPDLNQFGRHIFRKGSEVIAVGSPEGIQIECTEQQSTYRDLAWWVPAMPQIQFEHGETITVRSEEFSWYFEHVDSYDWFASDTIMDHVNHIWVAQIVNPKANHLNARISSLADTRFGRPVAFEILLEAGRLTEPRPNWIRHRQESPKWTPICRAGRVFWLPAATRLSPTEAINSILAKRFGIVSRKQVPHWALDAALPRAEKAQDKVDQLEKRIDRLKMTLDSAHERLCHEQRLRGLLFEQGGALEEIVHDALERFALWCSMWYNAFFSGRMPHVVWDGFAKEDARGRRTGGIRGVRRSPV